MNLLCRVGAHKWQVGVRTDGYEHETWQRCVRPWCRWSVWQFTGAELMILPQWDDTNDEQRQRWEIRR